jgi:hypothetical protein
MNRTCILLTFLLSSMAMAEEKPGAHAVSVLEKATQLELYSLDPLVRDNKEGFNGYKILGKTTVNKADTYKIVVNAFQKGVEESKGRERCFNPRHGIRCKLGDTTMDLLICFECLEVKEYYDEKAGAGFPISKSPQPAFDKVLKDADIPLGTRPKQ